MTALLLFSLVHVLPAGPEPDPLALFRQWSRSPSAELRIQAARTLRGHRGRTSRAALLSLLADDHPGVRAAARDELARRPPDEGPDLARDAAALRSPRARVEALRVVLARREDPALFVADRDAEVRARALASGRVPGVEARALLRDPDARVRALALETVHDPELARALARDRAEEVRIAVARVADDAGTVAGLLRDRSWRVRLAAVRAAERLREKELVPGLIRVLEGEPGRVRARALEALETITQASPGDDARAWTRWWSRAGPGFEVPPPRPPKRKEHTTAVIRFRRIPVVSRRLCFVLDASRSMSKPAPGAEGKSRWDVVMADLLEVLRRLPTAARFNVVLFRTDVEAWKPRLVPASGSHRKACRRWIEAGEPSGWTNLYDALALALSDNDVDALYVLTDGVPSRGAETKRAAILGEIGFLNHYRLVQINCVQAGSDEGLSKSWRGFLDDLAKAHGGISVRE